MTNVHQELYGCKVLFAFGFSLVLTLRDIVYIKPILDMKKLNIGINWLS